MSAPPSGTVTLLFTDIEGSTRLLKQLRTDYGELLAEHHRLMRATLEEHAGREMDTQGEAFFAVFSRAKDAVAAAIAAHAPTLRATGPRTSTCACGWGFTRPSPKSSEIATSGSGCTGPHDSARLDTVDRSSCRGRLLV